MRLCLPAQRAFARSSQEGRRRQRGISGFAVQRVEVARRSHGGSDLRDPVERTTWAATRPAGHRAAAAIPESTSSTASAARWRSAGACSRLLAPRRGSGNTSVAAEQFISTIARKGYRDLAPRERTDQHRRNLRATGLWLVEPARQFGNDVESVRRRNPKFGMVGAEMTGHGPGVRRLVETLLAKPDREGVDPDGCSAPASGPRPTTNRCRRTTTRPAGTSAAICRPTASRSRTSRRSMAQVSPRSKRLACAAATICAGSQ